MEALNHYTLGEICFLMNGPASLCKHYPSHDLDDCSVGTLVDGRQSDYCNNNLGSMLRFHTTKPWPDSRNILDLMRMMKSRGSNTIVLVGDSISAQQHAATRCILKRYGLKVSEVQFSRIADGSIDSFQVYRPSEVATSEDQGGVVYFQVLQLYCYGGGEIPPAIFDSLDRALARPTVSGKAVIIVNVGLHYRYGLDAKFALHNRYDAQSMSLVER
jgi:hypothetical protein